MTVKDIYRKKKHVEYALRLELESSYVVSTIRRYNVPRYYESFIVCLNLVWMLQPVDEVIFS